MTGDRGGLSAFQIELARLFFSLPESVGFLLAGGSALNAQGLVTRPTDDLDFFTQRGAGDVPAASEALTRAVEQRDWTVEVVLAAPEFRRLRISGPEPVLVDLAVDSPPTAPATITIAGPALAAPELAVRKTLALFGRAEGRDFTDVFMLHQRFDRNELITRAAELDPGFDLQIFTQSLRTGASPTSSSPTSAFQSSTSGPTSTHGLRNSPTVADRARFMPAPAFARPQRQPTSQPTRRP